MLEIIIFVYMKEELIQLKQYWITIVEYRGKSLHETYRLSLKPKVGIWNDKMHFPLYTCK